MTLENIVHDLEEKIAGLSENDPAENPGAGGFRERRFRLIASSLASLDEPARARILDEFDGWGPLTPLLAREDLTEILLNGPDSIWVESGGRLIRHDVGFLSVANYARMLERLCLEAGCHLSIEHPSADGRWKGFRVHVSGPPLSGEHPVLSLRRHPDNPWTLERLTEAGWCSIAEARMLRELIRQRSNFLVIGPTSAGKTSVVNALLAESRPDRALVLEDCREIHVPPGASIRLLTRHDVQGQLPDVTLTELLRQSLRLRPDRIVVGEVRGGEAKDYLLALSTGHAGSFGTLHAESPAQALLRLEMLVQMGSPEWGLETVRRLIRLSLHGIVVCGKNERGERRFKGLHRVVSLEESGFVLEPVEPIPLS